MRHVGLSRRTLPRFGTILDAAVQLVVTRHLSQGVRLRNMKKTVGSAKREQHLVGAIWLVPAMRTVTARPRQIGAQDLIPVLSYATYS